MVIILIVLCLQLNLNAQSPPPGIAPDKWILDESKSDEFNGSTLDASKWWQVDPCNDTAGIHRGYNWSPGAYFRPQNVSVSNGNLVLTVDYNPDSLNDSFPCIHSHPYPFYSGGVVSVQTDGGPELGTIGKFSFGYYEIRAKLPGYYDTNHQPIGYGFWPTFWFYYEYFENSCLKKHDEVDIIDNGPADYYDAKTIQSHWFDEYGTCSAHDFGQDSMRSATPLFDDYHKYAVELFPDKITFFFDDQPFFSADTFTFPDIAHSLNMAPYLTVVMDIQMGGKNWSPPLPDAPFPEFMYIDYFRYYHLNIKDNVLMQNYPNPVKNIFNIEYTVDISAVSAFIILYNILGDELMSYNLNIKTRSEITLNASELPSGVYLYSLIVDDKKVDTKKMIVMH